MNWRLTLLPLLFLLALLASVSASSWTPPPVMASPDACPELYTDYSLQCSSSHTQCGSFCFYAECLDCKNARHRNHGRHCHDDDDDDDYAAPAAPGSWYGFNPASHCHRDHGYHTYEKSPCISWDWHLYDPSHNRSRRSDTSAVVNIADDLTFGRLPDSFSGLTTPSCDTERNTTENYAGGDLPGNPRDEVWTSGFNDPGGISITDLTHLPNTLGESGAPTLSSLTRVDDRTMTLGVVGAGSNTVQYRWWSYSGVRELVNGEIATWDVSAGETGPAERSPSELRVPFEDLPSNNVTVNGVRGIVSFQVRMVDANGVASGVFQHQARDDRHGGVSPGDRRPVLPGPAGGSAHSPFLGHSPAHALLGKPSGPAGRAHPVPGQRDGVGGCGSGGDPCGNGAVSLVASQRVRPGVRGGALDGDDGEVGHLPGDRG